MGVVSVTKTWSGRSGGAGLGIRRAQMRFLVEVDSPADPPSVARTASGIPQPGQSYVDGSASDPWMICRQVDAEQRRPCVYEVTCRFETPRGTGAGDSPLDEPAKVRLNWVSSVEPIDEDRDGNPIVTANGEAYDPPLTDEWYDMVLTIERNQASLNLDQAYAYRNAVNNATFRGFAAGTCRMAPIEAEEFVTDELVYVRATFKILIRLPHYGVSAAQVWHRRVLHRGFLVRENAPGDTTQIVHARDERGLKVSTPVLLDAGGFRITDPAQAHYQMWPLRTPMDFDVWDLE